MEYKHCQLTSVVSMMSLRTLSWLLDVDFKTVLLAVSKHGNIKVVVFIRNLLDFLNHPLTSILLILLTSNVQVIHAVDLLPLV